MLFFFFHFVFLIVSLLAAAVTYSKFRIVLNLGFLNYWQYSWLIFVAVLSIGVELDEMRSLWRTTSCWWRIEVGGYMQLSDFVSQNQKIKLFFLLNNLNFFFSP